MAFAEDLSLFFDAEEFADEATLTPGGGGVVIFDRNGLTIEDLGVQTEGPSAVFPTTQWPNAAVTHTLSIGSTSYTVRAVTPLLDGAITLLTLTR
jgi:hypothetical protein